MSLSKCGLKARWLSRVFYDDLAQVIIIVYTMDRLVRPPEDGDEWDSRTNLITGAGRIRRFTLSIEDNSRPTSPAHPLPCWMLKSAGDERRKIIERTSRGKMSKAKKGKVVGSGHPPYGYDFSDNDLVINED